MATNKAQTAKTGDKPVAEPQGDGTKLATVADPAKVTTAKIDEIAGEHSDETDPEQSANVDVADTLKHNKADAKAADEPVPTYFHGQGGAAGI